MTEIYHPPKTLNVLKTEIRGIKSYLIQFKIFIFCLCIYVCIFVFKCHVCGCLSPEEVMRSPGAPFPGSCKHLMQVPGSKLRSSGEQ